MESQNPIPIPRRERWRVIRLRLLPVVIFAATTLLIASIWRDTLMPPTFTGEVERIESRVASAEAATLTGLMVSRFQVVSRGTPIAVVDAVDRRVLGYDIEVQRLRLSWLQQKVDLATAESNLQFAEIEFSRAESLLKKKVISPQEYDVFLKKRQALQSDISERKKLVVDLQQQIAMLPPALTASFNLESPATVGSKILTAPIDGMVNMIWHRPGESVMAGEPIVTIAAPSSSHVIGYMREPIGVQPAVGMTVRIRGRDAKRAVAYGSITRVGVAFEPITPDLQNPMLSRLRPETGLPVEVTILENLQMRPGGIVDVTILPDPPKAVASRKL